MLHPRLEALFSGFNQASLRWCLLRLPSGTGLSAGDVDLLVDGAQAPQFCQALALQGFTRLPGWYPGLHYVDFDLATSQWIWLHLVTELTFGRSPLLRTHAETLCLEQRQQRGVVSILADGDAFWELLLHCLVDKGQVPDRHKPRLLQLVSAGSDPGALHSFVVITCQDRSLVGRVIELVKNGCWTELEDTAAALVKALAPRNRLGQSLVQAFHQKMRWLRSRFTNRGMSVALLGPDGAGKSTLLEALQDAFIFPVRPVYMGLTGGLLRYVNKLWLPFLVIPGRLLVFWGRYGLAQFYRLRGRLVVFDRYIYDYAVPTPYPLGWLERLYRWIDGHSLPAPDLILILDAPGEVMFQRKGEYNAEMLENWRQHFLALRDRLPNCDTVDTTRSIQAVRADVIQRIWQRYQQRWGEQ